MRGLVPRIRLKDAFDQLEKQRADDASLFHGYARLLRLCGDSKSLQDGQQVHSHIVERGWGGNPVLGDLLVQMYGKCGSPEHARAVFNDLPRRSAFSWNFMIGAYEEQGRAKEALDLYGKMRSEGVQPDRHTFIRVLCACSSSKALAEGKTIHSQMSASAFHSDLIVQNALVNMYAKCGCLDEARRVFDGIRVKSVVSWNAMIAAYAQGGHCKEAIDLYQKMGLEGVQPNEITAATVIGVCDSPWDLEQGQAIHASLARVFGGELGVMVETALVNMYSKCGRVDTARSLFDEMKTKNVVSWNAMIAGYTQQGHGRKALLQYHQMDLEGMQPNSSTFATILAACSNLGTLDMGREIYARITRSGFQSQALQVAIVNLYAKCGSLHDARRVFDGIQQKSVVLWTATIAGYAQQGHSKQALDLYQEMDSSGVQPNEITFCSILGACSTVEQGKTIHGRIISSGLKPGVVLETALANMYAKCGDFVCARSVFDKMSKKDVVAWNAMIVGYVQHGNAKEALELYSKMDVESDNTTLASALGACSILGALAEGKAIHAYIIERRVETDEVVETALVNMYAKCGSVEVGRSLFDKIRRKSVVFWNTMIAAYAQHGNANDALLLYERMGLDGVQPDATTFLCILVACSHAGVVEKGKSCFRSLVSEHEVIPALEHYHSLADLFGRAGHLDLAEETIDNMPFEPDLVAWKTLLGACRVHGDLKRARRAAERIVEMDPELGTPYVLLSNAFAEEELKRSLSCWKIIINHASTRIVHTSCQQLEMVAIEACCCYVDGIKPGARAV